MKLGIRILLGYFLIVAIAGYFIMNIFVQEIRPGMRRVSENMLKDTANFFAKFIELDIKDGVISTSLIEKFYEEVAVNTPDNNEAIDHDAAQRINNIIAQSANEDISQPIESTKDKLNSPLFSYQLYVTDDKGIVLYDSLHNAVGKDYSQLNDVALTLRGEYSSRMTNNDWADDDSYTLYVAAPIKYHDNIIGVVTVSKSSQSLLPLIRSGELKMKIAGFFLLGIALIIGVFFVWWITHSISRLVQYATDVADGKPASLPKMENSELKMLGEALHKMRIKLEGKNYIESYVHTLTHELKSPLAAIRGAAEILQEMPPPEAAKRFSFNIEQQSKRLQLLVERMLLQANVESRLRLELQPVDLRSLVLDVVASKEAQAATLQIELDSQVSSPMIVLGDYLLLSQALTNLIENAFDFTPRDGLVRVFTERSGNMYQIIVIDSGSGIPNYALDKIFDRFYSLPRPSGKGKSTGLGLSFVREVASLHKGSIILKNAPERGAMAILNLLRYS